MEDLIKKRMVYLYEYMNNNDIARETELAKQLGISVTTLVRFKKGEKIKPLTLMKIAKVLNVEWADLL